MNTDMTFDEWVKKYKPEGGDWPIPYNGCDGVDPDCVWTQCSCDGETWIESGACWVNRDCYYVTEIPCPIRGTRAEAKPIIYDLVIPQDGV
jgi:hypothetical protein